MSGESVAIEVRDLHKSFRIPDPAPRGLKSRLLHPVEVQRPHELHVLHGISFDVLEGEFFGIVGRNGSGKSTLLRMLSSIYQVDRGSVRVAGRVGPLIELGVGFDPQLSARENVVLNGVMLGLTPRELRRRADAMLEFAEVEQFGDVPLKNFSSGMRVRLAFASLVQADPDILLVDEILAVGDAGFREKCIQTFLELKESGKTIVFVTHNMHDVKTYCDRAMLLEAGQIAEHGAPDEVARRYYEVTLQHRRSEGDNIDDGTEERLGRDLDIRARIAELRLNGSNGWAEAVVGEGAPLELAAKIEVERRMQASGLRLEIRTEHGARVFAPPDSSVSVDGGEFEPGQIVRAQATIENRLAPGRYTVACTLLHAEGRRKVAASPVRTLEFEVAGDTKRGTGLVSLEHQIQIEPGGVSTEALREPPGPAQAPRTPPGDEVVPEGPGQMGRTGDDEEPVAPVDDKPDRINPIIERLKTIAVSPLFAYLSIALIQLKLLWGIGSHRDLSAGDTSKYFSNAAGWADSLDLNALGAALYQVAWGSMQWFINGIYDVTITHRVVIVLAASLLVLAVLRRLLTPGVAWVLALWWTLLPVNFDVSTEVHLFALLPALGVVLFASSRSGLVMRSAVFGLLLLCTILVRQEFVVSALVWLGAWILFELWLHRNGVPLPGRRELAIAFGAPVAALVVAGAALSLLDRSHGSLMPVLEAKGGAVTCQHYAFGYVDRHDDFAGDPAGDCEILAQREFGDPRPSMVEAFTSNPGAITDHVLWNARLTPLGLQQLMLGSTSASEDKNPDVINSSAGGTGSGLALLGSLILLGFVVTGLVLLWRERRRWWESWVWQRAPAWFALASLAASAAVVCFLVRPRPEYLYALSVLILSVVGLSAMAIADRWKWVNRLLPAVPVVALLVLLAAPTYYGDDYYTPQTGEDRPLLRTVSRLEPFADEIGGAQNQLALPRFGREVCQYVGGASPCEWAELDSLVSDRPPGIAPAQWLDQQGVNLVYLDEEALSTTPAFRPFVAELEGNGWERLGPDSGDEGWELLRRTPSEGAAT